MATPNLKGGLSAVTPKVLASVQLASGDNTLYTAGASKAAKIDSPLQLTNVSAAAVVVSVSVVPSGGALDGTHKVIHALTLGVGETASIDEVQGWLGAGDLISVNASAAASVDATLRGLEFS